VKARQRREQGSMLVALVLSLPILLLLLALAIEAGQLFYVRALLQAVADHAALSAVQLLDFAALAKGDIRLEPDPAVQRAAETLRDNLDRAGLHQWLSGRQIRIRVYNAQPDRPLVDGWTGRALEYPTVCIVVAAQVRPLIWPALALTAEGLRVEVHADASVEPRQ